MPVQKRRRARRQHHVAATWIFVIALVVLGGGLALRSQLTTFIQPRVTATSESSTPTDGVTASQKAFIKEMAAPAVRVYRTNGQVFPSIVIAQAILESNWGQSALFIQAKNPFGVKGTYQGSSKTFPTTEYLNGKKVTVNAAFRNYPTLTAAILDHDTLLKTQFLRGTATDYQSAANLLQQNGYATDPNYAAKLQNVIATYQLNRYDT